MFSKNDNERGKPATERGVAPLLPLRDIIVFPHMVSQLFVGRERSIAPPFVAAYTGVYPFLHRLTQSDRSVFRHTTKGRTKKWAGPRLMRRC